jgi:hypothetical protein
VWPDTTTAAGRRLPPAISMNERLLVAVAHQSGRSASATLNRLGLAAKDRFGSISAEALRRIEFRLLGLDNGAGLPSPRSDYQRSVVDDLFYDKEGSRLPDARQTDQLFVVKAVEMGYLA